MLNKSENLKNDLEFKLIDLVWFFKRNFKIVVLFMAMGFIFSIFYYLSSEKHYLAEVNLKAIQYTNRDTDQSIIIELPALIEKIKSAIKDDLELQKECGFSMATKESNFFNYISFVILKVSPPKLQVTVHRPSSELARECINAVANKIYIIQISIIKEKIDIENTKVNLDKVTERLIEDKNTRSKLNLGSQNNLSIYFALTQSIRNIEDQRQQLLRRIAEFELINRRYNFEMYLGKSPEFPPKFGTLFIGLIVGFYLGLFFAVFREIYYKYK
ncbi:GumC domain-containing protein [Polynucleobacter difficilis]|uniref:hypothetical protein n=1 Tax=Polynucleobacter difficilis TaxID=556054 RepID=UPI00131EDA1E|nr:hypothetical protein [Polynucleobacter difficilis]